MSEYYEKVNHPPHYRIGGVECIDVVEHTSFCIGSAIKYLWRAGSKPGVSELEDLRKAAWYVNREIDRLERSRLKEELGDLKEYIAERKQKDVDVGTEHLQQNREEHDEHEAKIQEEYEVMRKYINDRAEEELEIRQVEATKREEEEIEERRQLREELMQGVRRNDG